jgi:hypothetical protein
VRLSFISPIGRERDVGILNVVIGIIVLIVAVWIAIFGGVGALLSRSRGGSGTAGLAWGTLLGPVGWLIVLWVTRRSAGLAAKVVAPPLESDSAWTLADPGNSDPWGD